MARVRSFRDIPIEQKLVVTIVVTTAVALLLSGTAILVLDSVSFRAHLREDLSAQAQIIADNSSAEVAFDDPRSAEETLGALHSRPHVAAACIFRLDGSTLATYRHPGARETCPAPRPQDAIWFGSDDLFVSRSILLQGQPIGTLMLVYDLGEISERLRDFGALVLGILLASGAIALLVSSRLRNGIVDPIKTLARHTSHVARTRDYTVRAKKTSADELGVLVDGFNEMLFSIQSRDDDLKHALAEREHALSETRAIREQLELITDTMASAVSRCGRDERFIWVSRQYAKWLKIPGEEIAGRPIASIIGEKAFDTLRPFIARVRAGERVEFEQELDYATIGRRWIRGTYVPTQGNEGSVDGWVAEITDITALKQAQQNVIQMNRELQRSNANLARSNEDLERFAYVASHDLQEPLRMVTTYSQLLVRNCPQDLGREAALFVNNIVEGTRRMRTLLSDLLAYTAINGGDEPLEVVDLNVALDNAKNNLKAAIAESGAVITSEGLPVLHAREGHFVSLLQNLIGNAIKYRDAAPPSIHVSVRRANGELRVAVADNGMGIAPEYHQKIFVPFKRLHGRKIPGTGIGLAICQRVVERYGGRLWVESATGSGSTFIFTLPESTLIEREAAAVNSAANGRSNEHAAL